MNKRVLIKLSGESLAGEYSRGLDFSFIKEICLRIKKLSDMGVKVGVVCGGGNFLRGRDAKEMDRERADYVGMVATIMNSLVLRDMFLQLGCKVYNQSGLSISIIDDIDTEKIDEKLDSSHIVIFGGGTGRPFFSTDTASALRAKDMKADLIIKLTNVDGVYDKDPNKDKDAKMYDVISYQEVIDNDLKVMDREAIEICRDNNIEIVVCNISDEDGLLRIINGEKIGSRVC